MRIYDMRCIHEMCGRVFDWHTKVDIYERSKKADFIDVHCWHCGRLGAKRAFTSAPADVTVKGTWGKHASPELKGKDYYGKQEYERQVALSGRIVQESGDSHGKIEKKADIAASTTKRDLARETITALLEKKGELKLKDIIDTTGLDRGIVHEVVYKDPGRIQKTGWGMYGLTGAASRS